MQWMVLVVDEESRKLMDNAVKEDDILNENVTRTLTVVDVVMGFLTSRQMSNRLPRRDARIRTRMRFISCLRSHTWLTASYPTWSGAATEERI